MGESNIEEFAAVLEGEAAIRSFEEAAREEMLAATPEQLGSILETLLGPEDRAVLGEGIAGYFLESAIVGLADGVDGWVDDDLAFAQPWGFELGEINRPVLLLHGDDDMFVPVAHGRWLAERIPEVDARIDPKDGHLTLIERRVREAHDWLLARL
jgi:pimeloyl-ACP methyl ester carboxylesterase